MPEQTYYQRNKARLNAQAARLRKLKKEENKEKALLWYQENKEYHKGYYKRNKTEINKNSRDYYKKNKASINQKQKNWYKSDPSIRIAASQRVRIRRTLKAHIERERVRDLIGCTIQELKEHLEGLFTEGMSWDNYGYYGWHIDHIIPCAKFDLTDEEQQKKCFNYMNLQPLWAIDNLSKGSTVEVDESIEAVDVKVIEREPLILHADPEHPVYL